MTTVSASKLEKLVDKTILDSLAPFGFVKDETGGSFCDRGDVYLYVGGLTRRLGGKNRIEPFGQVGFASANRIKFAFMEPGKPIRKATGTFQVHYRHFAGERDAYIGCETEEELPHALERVRDLTLHRLLPCLEKHTDPKQVLQAYIAHDEHQKNSLGLLGAHDYNTALSGLILARLYGREHYEPLKRRYQHFIEPLMPELKEKALKLIAYLDSDPLPSL
ncbi:hypothetical protein [Nevskia soli]|uniref:hypothetical protein n=1 Tax=Nevskia soli TaxID=418856 RepID=UPI0004A6C8F8|nr:hypothetical protein [Nevskia soli]